VSHQLEYADVIDYWCWYRGRRECTYAQSGVGVERVREMGESRGGKVRRWTDVPLQTTYNKDDR
jgi:hypothetical protein